MAISASTTATNRVFREVAVNSLFMSAKNAISTAVSWNQGDLLYLDTSAHLIKVVAASGNAATCLGIAVNTVISGKLQGPYQGLTATTAAEAIADLAGPVFGVEALLILKTSDAFVTGGKVYLAETTNAQTVTSTDPGDGNFIGIYVDVAKTAAAGDQGVIRLIARGSLGAVVA